MSPSADKIDPFLTTDPNMKLAYSVFVRDNKDRKNGHRMLSLSSFYGHIEVLVVTSETLKRPTLMDTYLLPSCMTPAGAQFVVCSPLYNRG